MLLLSVIHPINQSNLVYFVVLCILVKTWIPYARMCACRVPQNIGLALQKFEPLINFCSGPQLLAFALFERENP